MVVIISKPTIVKTSGDLHIAMPLSLLIAELEAFSTIIIENIDLIHSVELTSKEWDFAVRIIEQNMLANSVKLDTKKLMNKNLAIRFCSAMHKRAEYIASRFSSSDASFAAKMNNREYLNNPEPAKEAIITVVPLHYGKRISQVLVGQKLKMALAYEVNLQTPSYED